MANNIKENIKPSEIQAELNGLRETHPNKSTSCLFNLMIYCQDSSRMDYFHSIVDLVKGQIPCRIIFINGEPAAKKAYLSVDVSADSPEGNKDYICEQITIKAGGDDLKKVPFLILPFFVSDLPIYLLWGQNPSHEDSIFPQLQKYSTRVIIDSDASDRLKPLAQSLLAWLASSTIPFVDMNWARLGGWREVVAKTFDSKERLEQLAAAKHLKITYNSLSQNKSEIQALYLQAWLASRLDWKLISLQNLPNGCLLHYQGKQPLKIELIPEQRNELPPDDVIEIEVSNGDNCLCIITRKGDHQVMVHSSNQFECKVPFSLLIPSLRSGRTFIQEIFYQKMSPQYSPMLQLLSQELP